LTVEDNIPALSGIDNGYGFIHRIRIKQRLREGQDDNPVLGELREEVILQYTHPYFLFSRSNRTRMISLPGAERNSLGRSFPDGAKHIFLVFAPSS